jgi:hypothetical protein
MVTNLPPLDRWSFVAHIMETRGNEAGCIPTAAVWRNTVRTAFLLEDIMRDASRWIVRAE